MRLSVLCQPDVGKPTGCPVHGRGFPINWISGVRIECWGERREKLIQLCCDVNHLNRRAKLPQSKLSDESDKCPSLDNVSSVQ